MEPNELIVVTGDPEPAKVTGVQRDIIIVGGGSATVTDAIKRMIESYESLRNIRFIDFPETVDLCMLDTMEPDIHDCSNDHGERTNGKLKDQPFYIRGRKGKMRRW